METDPRIWIAALRRSHERLASLVPAEDDARLNRPSYAEGWSIAQVLSHLGSGAEIADLLLTAALADDGVVDREAFASIWAAWDAKDPRDQAAECLAADRDYVSRLVELSDDTLATIRAELFGLSLDATGLVRLRLGEHAVHTWDVAVALDPAAEVAPDAVTLLMDYLPQVARRCGRAAGDEFRVRLRTTDPEADYLLSVTDSVALQPWRAITGTGGGAGPGDTAEPGGTAAGPPDGEILLPGEAMLRLVYGRLDAGHTPEGIEADGIALDRLRKIFPGF